MIDPARFGVSFSGKQCRSFQINEQAALDWLLTTMGFRRFRLMSYWNEIETQRGSYDFTALDRQIDQIAAMGGVVSLCLGLKQPRWPEYHWPTWAKQLEPAALEAALLDFIEIVVARYRQNPAIISWQLENEALLKGFGVDIRIDRRRLRHEYALVKHLDPARPVIMSTSNGWGIPLRAPIPDCIGFSLYTVMYARGKYRTTIQKAWLYRVRAWFVQQFFKRPVYIHELQLEPWGPKAVWEMSRREQAKSMDSTRITRNLTVANRIGHYPIDLWGAEWWYWLSVQYNENLIWQRVEKELQNKRWNH